jgi:hypothetical protein
MLIIVALSIAGLAAVLVKNNHFKVFGIWFLSILAVYAFLALIIFIMAIFFI